MNPRLVSGPIELADGLYRVQALRTGHWDYPGMEGGLEITPALLSDLQGAFDAGIKGSEVPLNREHDDERPCGWVKGLQVDGDALYALFEITDPDTRELVDQRSLRYASSELDLAWWDPEHKAERAVFEGLALTNRPYLKNMEPIVALGALCLEAEDGSTCVLLAERARPTSPAPMPAGANMDEKDNAGTAALSEMRTELTETRTQLAETRAQLRMRDVDDRLKGCVRRGKLTAPAHGRLRGLLSALIAEGSVVVKLACKRKLADDEEPVDQIDVADAILDVIEQLPSAITVDPDEATLADGEPCGEDSEDQIDKEAKAMMAEQKGLRYRDAVKAVKAKLRGR